MDVIEILELVGIAVAIFFGIVSWVNSVKANKTAEEANKISKDANALSERSIKISERMEKETKENIKIKRNSNLMLLKNDEKFVRLKSGKSYCDFLCVIPLEITNLSSMPVTLKRPTFYWGKDGEYLYLSDDEFITLESYKDEEYQNVNPFPLYFKEKETKNIFVVIEFTNSDRLVFYSNKGITLNFEATQSNYSIYINEQNVIDNE